MGKTKLTYEGTEYDSQEEIEFKIWLKDAKELGLIRMEQYKPDAINLCPSYKRELEIEGKKVKRTFIQKKEYRPDWCVTFTKEFAQLFPNVIYFNELPDRTIWIDVKGPSPRGYQNNSSYYTFPLKQAWIYQQHGIFVQKIIGRPQFKKGIRKPSKKGLFLETWVPTEVLFIKGRKALTIKKNFRDQPWKSKLTIKEEIEWLRRK